MRTLIKDIYTSYKTSLWLLLFYALCLAIGTIIEKYYGTQTAKDLVYYNRGFFLLQFLIAYNFLLSTYKNRLFKIKRIGFLMVHLAFIVMLCGAMVSFFFSEEGVVHIREGETVDHYLVQNTSDKQTMRPLPFALELKKFTLTRYPGSESPSSYESDLLVHVDGEVRPVLIYMNNILDLKGYRFYQASFDKDELGTVLSVNRDVAGRNITYTGYALLFVGLILSIVGKNTRFRLLYKELQSLRKAAVVGLLLGFSLPMVAKPEPPLVWNVLQKFEVDKEHAKLFGSLPMQSTRGRMMPINTFSSEVLRKVHKSNTIGNMNSDQFLISLLTLPQMWMRVPFIAVPNEELSEEFSLTPELCTYMEFFDSRGNYVLQKSLDKIYEKLQSNRTKYDKDLLKLDEQVNTLYLLFNRKLLSVFPKEGDPQHKWYAPGDDLSVFSGKDSLFVGRIVDWYVEEVLQALKSGKWEKATEVLNMVQTYQNAKETSAVLNLKKIDAEVRYNGLEIFRWCKMGFLILGGLLLVLGFVGLFRTHKWMKWVERLLGAGVLIVFHYLMIGMTLRWYISGNAPSNSYETMIYVAWAVVVAGILFARRSTITFALSTLFGGVILFVSSLSWMDPHISPLVPVLKSPWLVSHVTLIITAYGFMGIACLLGITNLVLILINGKRKHELVQVRLKELTIINEMCLWIGLAFLTMGTFVGAIWANESWGRYWGWDPKEVWALITIMLYTVVLHLHLVKKYYSVWLFNLCTIVAFSSVLMTYFGVNYLLSGMHSYGNTDGVGNLFYYLVGVSLLIALLAWASRQCFLKQTKENLKNNQSIL